MAGTGTITTRERRRTTPQNHAVRRTIDVLDWAADRPPDRQEETRDVLRHAHAEAVQALRREPNPAMALLETRIGPATAAIAIATFLLGLGIGLSFGGAS